MGEHPLDPPAIKVDTGHTVFQHKQLLEAGDLEGLEQDLLGKEATEVRPKRGMN